MQRPTKSQIKAALEKLRPSEGHADVPQSPAPHLSPKKPNKNRIRKQGV